MLRSPFKSRLPSPQEALPGREIPMSLPERHAVLGTSLARDAFVVDAGIDLALRSNLTLGVSYSLQTGGNSTMNGVKADMRWKF